MVGDEGADLQNNDQFQQRLVCMVLPICVPRDTNIFIDERCINPTGVGTRDLWEFDLKRWQR